MTPEPELRIDLAFDMNPDGSGTLVSVDDEGNRDPVVISGQSVVLSPEDLLAFYVRFEANRLPNPETDN